MKLHEAIAITYAAVGQELTDSALKVLVLDLSGYPLDGVLKSLSRCRKELRRITLADIIERIPGGHPGAEEAWALVKAGLADEGETLCMTEPMKIAFFAATGLSDDAIAARMCFKEVYEREVAIARERGGAIQWHMSLGHDPMRREQRVLEAARLGRISIEHAKVLLPSLPDSMTKLLALADETRQIEDKRA